MAARMNISIPEKLKARIDACSKAVNWSKVAAEAFERRLREDEKGRIRDLEAKVAEGASSATASEIPALEALLEIVAEASPRLVDHVRKDLAPMFERILGAESELSGSTSFAVQVNGLEDLGDLVSQYHERVVQPLFNSLFFEIVQSRLVAIADRERA